MTRYRAIDIIKNEIECVNRQDTCEHKCAACELVLPDIEIFEAYDMAIKALSQEPTEKLMTVDEMEREYEKSKALFHKIVECDDAISREAVLDITWEEPSYTDALNVLTEIRDKVKALPSVTQKSGKWITTRTFMHDGEYYCNRCKCEAPNNEKWNYCPNCGAYMVEPQERNKKE